jgi:FkbM family methyltransferase
MASFVWSQLTARAQRGDVIVAFPNTTRLAVSPWAKGAAHYIFPRLCEFEEMSLVMHYLRPGDVFVDVGANIGAYTVLAAGVAGANVVGFEPIPRTFAQCIRNVELNQLGGKVRAINAAVGAEAGALRMTDDLGTENYIVARGGAGCEVPVITLDSQLAGQTPTLIKVDVEGFESAVFAGARHTMTLSGLQALIVERNEGGTRYGFDVGLLHRQIRDFGFSPFSYLPFERRLVPLPDDARGNLIYLRNADAITQRLRAATPYTLGRVTV